MFSPADDFQARVAALQSTLPTKLARLAAYIAAHYLQAVFMTTRELATAAGVSPATVVRLPAALGYESYAAMRDGIRDRINVDLTGAERFRTLGEAGASPVALLRRIVDADVQALHELANGFSEAQFERFVDALLQARHTSIIGFRFIAPLAHYFGYSLARVKPNVQWFTHADSTLYDHVQFLGPDDALVAVAVARYPADLVPLVRRAHERGVPVLALTDSPLSPVLPYAQVALFARSTMLDFVGSLGAPAALINCIVSSVGLRLGRTADERLQGLQEAAQAVGIYAGAGAEAIPSILDASYNNPSGSST